jgi:hypothetical protein
MRYVRLPSEGIGLNAYDSTDDPLAYPLILILCRQPAS